MTTYDQDKATDTAADDADVRPSREEQEADAAAKRQEQEPRAGDQCPHGAYWYAEVDSDNLEHPIGALDIDCTKCGEERP